MIFDFIGDLGSAPHWMYRCWGYLLSKPYRQTARLEYQKMSSLSVSIDILLCILFWIAEVLTLAFLIDYLVN